MKQHTSYKSLEASNSSRETYKGPHENEQVKKTCGMDSQLFVLTTCSSFLLFLFAFVSIVAFVIHADINEFHGKLFSFDDMFNSQFTSKRISLNWWNDTTLFKRQSNGDLVFSNIDGTSLSLLVNASRVVDYQGNILSFSYYSLSPNTEFVLLAVQTQKLWRHSFTARYLVYDTVLQTVFNLTTSSPESLSNVRWSPRTDRSFVAFVRSNNIFLTEVIRGGANGEFAVTTDGSFNQIINGVFSWVYEEEVFGGYNAIWWSPNGNQFAYMKSDETLVPEFSFPLYNGGAYTDEMRIKYPNAGYPNPIVSLYVFDITNNQTLSLDTLSSQFEYIYYVQWNGQSLYIQLVNRTQNYLNVVEYNIQNSQTTPTNLFYQSSDSWVDVYPLYFYGDSFFTLLPNNDYPHIAKFSLGGIFQSFITSGNWAVTSILSIVDNNIYYISTEVSSIQRHIYKISIDGSNKLQLTKGEGWYSAQFSPSGEYYVLEYSGPDIPYQTLFSTKDPSYENKLETNADLRANLAQFDLPTKSFFEIPTADGVQTMNGFAVYPPYFNQSSKYPVLMNVYGGPGSQYVHTRFDQTGFTTYVASQLGYIVATVDGRGTGGKSNTFKKQVYLNLGQFETEDQLAGAEYFQSLKYVDPTKISIWGWSYGGYMTARSLAFDYIKTRFRCGVSVAPVTDWIFYDSIYTERYMQTPQQNPTGYAASSVLPLVTNISDDRLLLIHGTGDDNVHWQNSAELAKQFIFKNIQFETMYYPNYDHGITARKHLYKLISDFLQRKLS